jgi:hypothetical protein
MKFPLRRAESMNTKRRRMALCIGASVCAPSGCAGAWRRQDGAEGRQGATIEAARLPRDAKIAIAIVAGRR